jgi:hypothetical protein
VRILVATASLPREALVVERGELLEVILDEAIHR